MKKKKGGTRGRKKARTTSGGTPWEKAGWRERGRERSEERSWDRESDESEHREWEREERRTGAERGGRGGARGGTEGGIRRVKEVRSEEGERASEMRA